MRGCRISRASRSTRSRSGDDDRTRRRVRLAPWRGQCAAVDFRAHATGPPASVRRDESNAGSPCCRARHAGVVGACRKQPVGGEPVTNPARVQRAGGRKPGARDDRAGIGAADPAPCGGRPAQRERRDRGGRFARRRRVPGELAGRFGRRTPGGWHVHVRHRRYHVRRGANAGAGIRGRGGARA